MKRICLLIAFSSSFCAFGQDKPKKDDLSDTAVLDYDEIFSELDVLLDDVRKPKSFGMVNVGVGNAYFTFQRRVGDSATAANKVMVSPSLSYFHRSGFGVTAETDLVNDGEKLNAYQYSLTGAYDYLRSQNFVTGLSYSHYFQKENLPFYTSPLKSDAFAYFTYRKYKLRPSVNFHYGWGSQEAVTVMEEKIRNLRITRTITTVKSVADLNLTTSLRYIFSWPHVFSKNDNVKFTPQVSFVSGTQQFGFNQVNNIGTVKKGAVKSTVFTTENLVLNDNMKFQPLALSTVLKTEYAKGRFFIQPQLGFDYYFPATTDNLTVSFIVNAGVTFF